MADRSKIEWCDATWNPITGCTPVSAGCENCYAKRMYERFNDHPFSVVTLHLDRLSIPLHWKKHRRVFVCSMGDLFHKDVPENHIAQVWGVMALCPQHTFMILTKRVERMAQLVTQARKNVWLGTTIENQKEADRRIWYLLSTPAYVRILSVEPMLGPIVFPPAVLPRVDWVICGGESGPGARPMHPDWPRSLRDQCQAAGVPFFFKQWGSHSPFGAALKGNVYHEAGWSVKDKNHGAVLDGREWKEFPCISVENTPDKARNPFRRGQ